MKPPGRSITRRVIFAVLALEIVTALAIIATVTLHEQHVQEQAFDANLRATANALLGAVQEGPGGNVVIDPHGIRMPPQSIFRVSEEDGRVLAVAGNVPAISLKPGSFQATQVDGSSYRFFTLAGERILDPDRNGGDRHKLTIVYGNSDRRVRREVIEAVQFVAASTLGVLALTTILLVLSIRRLLAPVGDLAAAAEAIAAPAWTFSPPQSAKEVRELRPLTTALETSIGRLQSALEQQRRFTNDAAHELKTDIAIVKSSFQLLTLKRRSVEEYDRGLGLGLNDLTRLEHTVQRMLTLARLEQASADSAEICRLDEVLSEAVAHSQAIGEVKSVSVHVAGLVPASVHLASRDALLLCSNVLINALQHSEPAGRVQVSMEVVEGEVVLRVRDCGEGFVERETELLFEPFYRADVSRSRKTGGTGLGLSICRAICARARGSILLGNHPEGGALVTVKLPLAGVSSASIKPQGKDSS